MAETKAVLVKSLALDLGNYRTVRQADEMSAVSAMILTSPDRFWALADSLLQDSYLPTESVIVLREGSKLTVKEGNRRIAALKLIHGMLPLNGFSIPGNVADQIASVSPRWRKENVRVPCTIYEPADKAKVDRIVTLAHGKGEKASRDQWNAVARARHNRDANGLSEPPLDLLESYLTSGQNVTPSQKARWAGVYPLSILGEAMKRLAPRLGVASSSKLAADYPAIKHRDAVEAIVHAIGMDDLGFEIIRNKTKDFALTYGIPDLSGKGTAQNSGASQPGGANQGVGTKSAGPKGTAQGGQAALATGDPRAVRRLLKEWTPKGKKREKVVALKDEAIRLDLRVTPLAFCFVLRSMFEISAKAYCDDHISQGGPSASKAGQDKKLVDVLRSVTQHLTSNKSDKDKVKVLHGAMAELAKNEGLLSVTSMNQLIHNPRFSIGPTDISILFGNVIPLLEAMNA